MTAEFLLGERCDKYPRFGEQKEGERTQRRELDRIFAVVIVVVIRKGRHLFISVVIVVGRRSGETLHHVCLKIFEEDRGGGLQKT